ncbi:uncharacterized protein [Drosophila tropicalis]|uniref:uncharacterized protein n=1 Tax=Drosophila tropicalis TaxID=46794 RepID=UPI0035AC02D3
MVRLIPFEQLFCMLGDSFDIVADSCRKQDDYFNFMESSRWRSIRRKAINCMNCKETCYPVYYWVLLVFSLYGTLQSICAFLYQIYINSTKTSGSWYNSKFHALPQYVLIRLAVIARFTATYCWGLLLYAVIYVSPSYMKPWIIIHASILALRLLINIIEAIIGRLWQKFLTALVSKAVQIFIITLVFQAMLTFRGALKNNSREKLMLSNEYINLL